MAEEFTPYPWQNAPNTTTPLDAAHLDAAETAEATWVTTNFESDRDLSALDYGAVVDGRRLGYVTSSSSTTAVSVGNSQTPFTSTDVGKLVVCFSDTVAGAVTTISAVDSSSSITLAANSGITLAGSSTGCFLIYGTDDSTAINAALTAAAELASVNTALGYNEPFGEGKARVQVPASGFESLSLVASQISVPGGVTFTTDSMIGNLQTDRYNPVVLFNSYSAFERLWVDACFGAGVKIGTSASAETDVQGGQYVAWHVGQGFDSGTSRYQDVLEVLGNSHLIDLIWAKGGYHGVVHNIGGDFRCNTAFLIGAVQPVSMSQSNQVRYNALVCDSCGQSAGGTSGIVLDNACSDVVVDAQFFCVTGVTRSLDNVVLLGNGSTNKNVDIRMKVSAQLTGGAGINLQQAQDVMFDLVASNTSTPSSGGASMTTGVVWGTGVAGACDIRAALSGTVTPYSGTPLGQFSYTRLGTSYTVQSGGTPTIAAQTANGSTPATPTVTGNDQRGFVSFGSGTSPTSGTQVAVTFSSSTGYVATPIVTLTARNGATEALSPYVTGTATTGFSVGFNTGPTGSQTSGTYALNYRIDA